MKTTRDRGGFCLLPHQTGSNILPPLEPDRTEKTIQTMT